MTWSAGFAIAVPKHDVKQDGSDQRAALADARSDHKSGAANTSVGQFLTKCRSLRVARHTLSAITVARNSRSVETRRRLG